MTSFASATAVLLSRVPVGTDGLGVSSGVYIRLDDPAARSRLLQVAVQAAPLAVKLSPDSIDDDSGADALARIMKVARARHGEASKLLLLWVYGTEQACSTFVFNDPASTARQRVELTSDSIKLAHFHAVLEVYAALVSKDPEFPGEIKPSSSSWCSIPGPNRHEFMFASVTATPATWSTSATVLAFTLAAKPSTAGCLEHFVESSWQSNTYKALVQHEQEVSQPRVRTTCSTVCLGTGIGVLAPMEGVSAVPPSSPRASCLSFLTLMLAMPNASSLQKCVKTCKSLLCCLRSSACVSTLVYAELSCAEWKPWPLFSLTEHHQGLQISGEANSTATIQVAHLAHKNGMYKQLQQRTMAFVGSPEIGEMNLLEVIRKNLKTNNVGLAVVYLGELEALAAAASSGVSGLEFGVNPELVLALQISLEDDGARQEAAPKQAREESSKTESTGFIIMVWLHIYPLGCVFCCTTMGPFLYFEPVLCCPDLVPAPAEVMQRLNWAIGVLEGTLDVTSRNARAEVIVAIRVDFALCTTYNAFSWTLAYSAGPPLQQLVLAGSRLSGTNPAQLTAHGDHKALDILSATTLMANFNPGKELINHSHTTHRNLLCFDGFCTATCKLLPVCSYMRSGSMVAAKGSSSMNSAAA